jgi:hypothetical protein
MHALRRTRIKRSMFQTLFYLAKNSGMWLDYRTDTYAIRSKRAFKRYCAVMTVKENKERQGLELNEQLLTFVHQFHAEYMNMVNKHNAEMRTMDDYLKKRSYRMVFNIVGNDGFVAMKRFKK